MSLSFIYDERTLKEALSDAIQRVLLLKGVLTIPSLGTFERKHEPARVVELPDGSVELTPPTDTVRFDPSQKGTTQTFPQELVEELADILSLSHIEIQKTYRELIDKIREELEAGKAATLPGLGTLRSGDQPFEPDPSLSILWGEFPPAGASTEKKAEQETRSFPSFFSPSDEEESIEIDTEALADDVWLPSDTTEPHPLGVEPPSTAEEASFTVEKHPSDSEESPASTKEESTEETMSDAQPSGLSLTPPEHPDPSAAVTASAFYNMFRAHPDSPQAAEALFWAAENYIKAGQIERAKAVFLEFLNYFPTHPRAEEIRQALNLPPGPPPEEEQPAPVATQETPEAAVPSIPQEEEPSPPPPEEETQKEWKPLAEALEENPPAPQKTIKPPPPPVQRKRRPTPLLYVILSGGLLVILLLVFFLNRGQAPESTMEQPPTMEETTPPPVSEQPPEETPASPAPETTTPEQTTPATTSFDPLRGPAGIIRERGGYTWVVASVASREKAEEIAARYRAQGYRTGVLEGRVQGRPIYRVGIGQFASIEEAQQARRELPPDAPRDAWILRIR